MAPHDSTTSSRARSSTPKSPNPSPASPLPCSQELVTKAVGKAAVTLSVLQEQLGRLQADVTELISPTTWSHASSPSSSDSALDEDESMSPEDINLAVANMRSKNPAPAPKEDESAQDITPLYSIQAPSNTYHVHICTHCTEDQIIVPERLLVEMQTKIADLASRGLRLVTEKAAAVQDVRVAKKEVRVQGRKMKQMVNEKDLENQVIEDLQGHLRASWWEVAALKLQVSAAEGRVQCLEDRVRTSERQVADVQKAADERAEGVVTSPHTTAKEIDALKQGLEKSESDKRNLENTVRDLSAENARLANVEADCQALVEMREVQEQDLEQERKAWRPSGQEAVARQMQELERRNEYLEERLMLYDREWASAYLRSSVTIEHLLTTSTGRNRSRWNTSNLSLRGPRRRGNEETGSPE
ncbi:hypothetical protein BU25DRAFT_462950 [Macroventuria anomochaeta]|uniref:Uncharacterized protein n=1 Tax=Macroventuria anomochaeta TaxID=301207 RepID=A0ACB6RKE2_9PLEO|nr:uncharacterized protein BU25DRAFT_462950 [Macroventuria anomochaeta]KAF2622415.1 hypothetical protein BU25DRAFT_462950 [Macroventuria anomochaeta]